MRERHPCDVAAVEDERRHPHRGKQWRGIERVPRREERACGLRCDAGAKEAGVPRGRFTGTPAHQDVGDRFRDELPVFFDEVDESRDLWRQGRGGARRRAPQHEVRGALGTTCGVRDRERRRVERGQECDGPAADGVEHRVEVADGGIEVARRHHPVRKAEAARVVTDEHPVTPEALQPPPVLRQLPFELDVTERNRRHVDERRARASDRERDADTVRRRRVPHVSAHADTLAQCRARRRESTPATGSDPLLVRSVGIRLDPARRLSV